MITLNFIITSNTCLTFQLKLKQANAIRTTDERLLRQYSDKIGHLTERNEKYKKLLKERDLEAREFLTHELEAEREKTASMEKQIAVIALFSWSFSFAWTLNFYGNDM